MNFRHLFLLVAALAGSVCFTSCKKEEKKTKLELLTTGSWKIVRYTTITNGNSYDLPYFSSDCGSDNTYTFRTDNKIIYDNGLLKCPFEQQQTFINPWNFLENETKIKMGNDSSIWNIEVLSAS
jgi:hypothetical protein